MNPNHSITFRLAGGEFVTTIFPPNHPIAYLFLLVKDWFITHKPKAALVYLKIVHGTTVYTIEHDLCPTPK